MKTTRNLILSQIKLADEIKAKANINLIVCCKCDALLLYKLSDEKICCYSCKKIINVNDCEDYLYSGMENNLEFNQ